MQASLILIGNELLKGSVEEKNGAFLASWLTPRGFSVENITLVGDEPEKIEQILQQAWKNSQLIITSGGLGPTQDDRTKEALASFRGVSWQENETAKALLLEQYQHFGKKWHPSSNNYHLIPENFFPVKNPRGLAPGLGLIQGKKLLLAAPGVPHELRAMAQEQWPALLENFFSQISQRPGPTQSLTLRTHSVAEEELFNQLDPQLWKTLEGFGELSSLPHALGIDLVMSFPGDDREKKRRREELQKALAHSPVQNYIWQWGDLSLPQYLLNTLEKKKLTLSLVESCTGGLCAHRLTNIAGSSRVFLGSAVTYSNQSKIDLLKVPSETINKWGAVSQESALAMAQGGRQHFQSHWSISLTGIAGPGGGTSRKPVGTVAIGLVGPRFSQSQIYHFKGDRERLKFQFSQRALFDLLLQLLDSF